ncbi:MAG: DUF423 domain-containing protein [Sulfobacillus sp.]|nr:DUF423 domain-containing protein [Sulfobacillus sp.]
MVSLLFVAAVLGFLGVGLGAFGAHGLRAKITPESLAVYQTGVQYHLIHTVAMVLAALLTDRLAATNWVLLAGWFFFGGIIVFSGSLYILAISGQRRWGAVTPIGGLLFLAGWALLAIAALSGI